MARPPIPSQVLDHILDRNFGGLPEKEREALKKSYAFLVQWIERLPRELPYDREPSHQFVAPEDSQ